MKQLTAEWFAKSEGDFAMVEREWRARKSPNYDGLCFHAQQCAEKLLKAYLCEVGLIVDRTHDLIALLGRVVSVQPQWSIHREDLAYLTTFAVIYRYPGESADRETARRARQACIRFRKAVTPVFGKRRSALTPPAVVPRRGR